MRIESIITFTFCIYCICAYFVSTGFNPLISPDYLFISQFGLHKAQPLTYFTYAMMHLYPTHLVMNVILLFFFGIVVERRLKRKKTLFFYFCSTVACAIFFLITSPTFTVVGASGVIWALIGASVVIKPKETLIALFVLGFMVVPLLRNALVDVIYAKADEISGKYLKITSDFNQGLNNLDKLNEEQQLEAKKIVVLVNKSTELKENITLEKKEITELSSEVTKKKKELIEKKEKGLINEIEFEKEDKQIQNLNKTIQIKQNLTKKKEQLISEIEQNKSKIEKIIEERNETVTSLILKLNETGNNLDKISENKYKYDATTTYMEKAPEAKSLHVFALFFGYVLLLLIDRDILFEWEERVEIMNDKLVIWRERYHKSKNNN